jgi:protein TonB
MKQEKSIFTFCLLIGFFAFSNCGYCQDTIKKPEAPLICFPEDELPQFYGGYKTFTEFITVCTMYPDSARLNGISGKVFVNFIVDEKGGVIHVKVLRGIGYGCDEEAMRVIRFTSGNWIPAQRNGKPVKVKYNIPINFKMN